MAVWDTDWLTYDVLKIDDSRTVDGIDTALAERVVVRVSACAGPVGNGTTGDGGLMPVDTRPKQNNNS